MQNRSVRPLACLGLVYQLSVVSVYLLSSVRLVTSVRACVLTVEIVCHGKIMRLVRDCPEKTKNERTRVCT